jgi:hypothetical protein
MDYREKAARLGPVFKELMMAFRNLVLLLAAGIVISLFMPWLNAPVGPSMVPWDVLSQMDTTNLNEAPPLLLAFIASFALAALLLVLCLTNSEHKLMAVVTGALPLGLLAFVLFQASEELTNLGLPQPQTSDLAQLAEQMMQVFGFGAFIYFGCAALLFLISLFDPGRKDA